MGSSVAVVEKVSGESPSTGIKASAFREEAGRLINEVRRTLLGVIEWGGRQVAKSDDAQKLLGIDSNLSWQIFKLANESDILNASQYIPARVSIQKIFAAARRKTVANEVVEAAETAFDHFETFMEIHAGDRAQFHSIALSLGKPAKAKSAMAEQHRKAAYKAHAFYWGVELETSHVVAAMGPPTGDGSTCDTLFVQSLLNYQCLRPANGRRVAGFNMREHGNIEPLDVAAMEAHGAPVLPQFSTKALPKLTSRNEGSGDGCRILLSGEEIGLTSGVDMVFGYVHRQASQSALVSPNLSSTTSTPTGQLFQEIFVHNSYPQMTMLAKIFGHSARALVNLERTDLADELPCFDEPIHDHSVDEARLLGVPRRREILAYCFEKMGWDIREFQVYRLQIAYPLLDTATDLILLRSDSAAS